MTDGGDRGKPVGWRGFDYEDVISLGRTGGPASGMERECPVCGRMSLRSYRYASKRLTGPTQISYVWCSPCHRYHGATGPLLTPGLSDPLNQSEHARLNNDLPRLFDRLDQLWDDGELPR